MWHVLVIQDGEKISVISGMGMQRDFAISQASFLNRSIHFTGRYFVVHESELALFGLEKP